MDEIFLEFITETNESLGELDTALVNLEQNPNDKDLLSKIFRVMHTIKGTSGFLNLPRLGSVAHKAEDLLGLFRDGDMSVTSSSVSLILESIDRIKLIMAGLENSGSEPEGDDSRLLEKLEAACKGEANSTMDPAIEENDQKDDKAEIHAAENASTTRETSIAAQSLRVNVDVLENLMTLVSELVLTRNQILQVARTQKDNGMGSSLQRLNHIVSDLQDGVMKTRMQPIGNAWSKLPRIVRDISTDLGKKIELEMFGQETELDRQVLEMIKDPLTHMIRNSADHGIETPAERVAVGKPETGRIRLDSYHEGGHILIEISDDGRGLAIDKIKKKILKNQLATEAELSGMSLHQIQQFIFHAGFSTAENITAVSGRGVGMDVVRTNIEKIGGSIEMSSVEGKGTTFIIKIPLTLAIVSSLIVGIDDERFAIPQLDVTELIMLSPGGQNKIETISNAPVFRLRENILPLICLRGLLKMPPRDDIRVRYIAVINVGSYKFGIIVDHVFDTEEIVVKPVNSLLKNQAVFSGNTILGDGQVIMILDSSGILKASGIANNDQINRDYKVDVAANKGGGEDETQLLLFNAGGKNLKAVPLEYVARLEEIDLANIEWAGGKRVVQYGNTLMPIHLCDARADLPASGKRPVIVFNTTSGQAGLLVDHILDITTHRGAYQIKSEGRYEGSAIVQGQATDIINLSYGEGKVNNSRQKSQDLESVMNYEGPSPQSTQDQYDGV